MLRKGFFKGDETIAVAISFKNLFFNNLGRYGWAHWQR